MLRCIAIDDEPLALELLEDNISKVPYLKLVGSFSNPVAAIAAIQEQEIDLVFLDIQMPGLTGLQLIQTLTKRPMFILITAYEKHALEAYHLDVVDYLLKPVSLDRFIRASSKAWELHQLRTGRRNEQSDKDYFFINVEYSLLKVIFGDVIYVEGLKDYVKIHLKSTNKPVVARMSLKGLEEELPASQFVRIHKSFIVSKNFVTSVKKNSVSIGDIELPVGENYKDSVNEITGRNL